jgi:Fur family ferric uptake transcriptional regulator
MISSTQTNHPLVNAAESGDQSSLLLDTAFEILRAQGLRITQPRIAILTALIHHNRPSTIEQIHVELKEGSCDLVTVYRCLAAFEEIGVVRRSFHHNGTSLYEISLGKEAQYHVVSRNAETLEQLDPESAAELREVIQRIEARLRAHGHSDVAHVVEFFTTAPAPSRVQSPLPVVN